MKTLTHFLSKVPDPRRKQGLRISLPNFLTIVILGNMSGHTSLQSLSRFAKNNEEYFIQSMGLLHGVPGYTRIRTLLKQIDFDALNSVFSKWALQYLNAEDWIHIDGKSMRSTATNYFTEYQDFHCLVCAFCNRYGLTMATESFQNKKTSEILSVEELLKSLTDKEVVITFDALHCQKKLPSKSWVQEMTM